MRRAEGSGRRGDALARAGLALAFVVLALLPGVAGDFPLNDDWSYGLAVERLLRTAGYHPTGWTSMPLVSQVLWGALFCLPRGFSFTALRVSTLVLGLAGVLATFSLARRAGGGPGLSLATALLVAANPLYLGLSHTFMTDVPFAALSALSLLLYLRALENGSDVDLAAATLAAGLATLIRQIGVALPAAWAIACLVKGGARPKNLARAGLPLLLVAALLEGFELAMRRTVGLPFLYTLKAGEFGETAASGGVISRLGYGQLAVLCYLGLFFLPLLPGTLGPAWRRSRLVLRATSVSLALLFLVLGTAETLLSERTMPLLGNVLSRSGLGPIALRDVFLLVEKRLPEPPSGVFLALTVASLAGGGILALVLVLSISRLREPRVILLLSAYLLFALPIGLVFSFDRYLLPLFAPLAGLLTLLAEAPRERSAALPFVFATGLAVFAVGATHDYLSFGGARWQALQSLLREGVPPSQIDGGFEFCGFYLYDPAYRAEPGKSWWWVKDPRFLVSLGPVEGYRTLIRRRFARWLGPDGEIFVLLRTGGVPPKRLL